MQKIVENKKICVEEVEEALKKTKSSKVTAVNLVKE